LFEEDGEIAATTLILWGVLLCDGTLEEKVRALYDVLQDNLQPTISAGD
jgi:hypothetical protein